MFGEWGIVPLFDNSSFENFRVFPWNERLIKAARDYVDAWPKQMNDGSGLILSGSTGTGKSRIASAIARELVKKGYNPYFCNTAKMLDEVYSYQREHQEDVMALVFDRLCSADILILDDVCKTDLTAFDKVDWNYNSDWAIGVITYIYEKRLEKNLPTITITWNMDKQFVPLFHFVVNRCQCIELGDDAVDMRAVLKEESEIYRNIDK